MDMDDLLNEMPPHTVAYMELDYLFREEPYYFLEFITQHTGEHLYTYERVDLNHLTPLEAPFMHFSNTYILGKTWQKEDILFEILFFPEEHYFNYGPYVSFKHYARKQRHYLRKVLAYKSEEEGKRLSPDPYHFDYIISIHLAYTPEEGNYKQSKVYRLKLD